MSNKRLIKMLHKKALFIMFPGDFAKGIILGLILGAVVAYLGVKGIIPIPFLR